MTGGSSASPYGLAMHTDVETDANDSEEILYVSAPAVEGMLSNKVCIVAGGGRGLGKASARELGSQGTTVVVNDLGVDLGGEGETEEPAREVADEIRDAGGTATAHFGDVSDLDYTEELVHDTVDEYGRIDGVVNFAGILRDSISYEMTEREWDEVINVHLKGHFSLLRNTAAHWREKARENEDYLDSQRSFLSVTSRAALGSVGQINYSSAKAGILGMTRSASQELDRYNVRVNALMPIGFTRMVESMPDTPFTEADMPRETPAAMVAFAMSDAAEDISGVVLRAEGNTIGVVSHPEMVRAGFQDEGWSSESIAAKFRSVAEGIALEADTR